MTSAKKGEMVAYSRRHSSVSASFKRDTYQTFHIGLVESATREGLVKSIRPHPGSYVPLKVDSTVQVFTISAGKQEPAKAIFNRSAYPGVEFETADDLKASILLEAGS